MKPIRLRILVLLAIGLCAICIASVAPMIPSPLPTHPVLYPLPHQIPKYPGGVSFRFAMVHDVVHDRYPRHGKVFFEERNRQVLATIAKNQDANGLPSPDQFGMIDDLGVGLDTLGKSDEAVRWLQLKLKAQEKLGLQGRPLYTSYANLGTFLIHGHAAKSMSGDKIAQDAVREGIEYLHKSINVNPEAHFGREIWQAIIAEFMLAVSKDRKLLLKYDMIGNWLELTIDLRHGRQFSGRSAMKIGSRRANAVRQIDTFLKGADDADQRRVLRMTIQTVGENRSEGLKNWRAVAFDEPCLGIIGMWRLGGGANPHFALALGETMMRVGQRHLAWAAYQRAIREAKRFSSDEATRKAFLKHCHERQSQTGFEDQELKDMEARFESELQVGRDYQRAYQQFEEKQIAAGKDLDDPHFYDAFHEQYGNIATSIGDADFLAVEEVTPRAISWTVFALGAAIFAAAFSLLVYQRRYKTKADKSAGGIDSQHPV